MGVWIERDVYHCSGSVGGEGCISLVVGVWIERDVCHCSGSVD